MTMTESPGQVDLSEHGIEPTGRVYRNPTTSLLYYACARTGRWTVGRRRASGCRHGPVHRPFPQGQVPGRRRQLTRPDLVGRRQPGAERRALQRIAREGDGAARNGRGALRRRRLGRGRLGAQDRRAGRHGASVPRALREDDVHRARAGRSRDVRADCARAAHARSRSGARRTTERAPARSSSCIRAAPSCSSAARSTRARSRSRSSP